MADQNFRVKRGLEVGLGATVLTALPSGFVGIGTTNPTSKLTVQGDVLVTGVSTIVANSSTEAFRITQTGTGNAFVVEDATNPDATPFVIMADGKVGVGTTGMIRYGSGGSDTSTFGILASTGNDSAFVLKGNNGSTTDGSGQTLAVLVGASGGSGSGTNLAHYSHDTSGIGTKRNSIRFTDTQIRFEDNLSGSVDVTINSSGSGELLVGRTSSTGTTDQLLQVQGGAYILDSVGIGTTNPTSKLHVVGDAYISGVLTAVNGIRGIGIQSGGVTITTGIITTLNFTGTAVSTITNTSGLVEINVKANQFVRVSSTFTATAGQTTFSVSYTPNYVDVFVNGVRLTTSEYVATNGTSIILNVSANDGDIIDVIGMQNGGLFDTSKWTAADPSNLISGNIYKASGFVGIGTTNPQALLQVGAAITESIIVTSEGILGIGGTNVGSATNKLQIITEGVAAEGLGIFGTWTSQNAEQGAVNFYGAKNSSGALANIVCIDNRATSVSSRRGSLVFKTANPSGLVEGLRIDSSQNVGIGTTNPTSKLTVEGDVLVSGITTINNNFVVNGNTLYADATNNRVGVGTTNPTSKLQVQGNTNINNTLPFTVSYASSFSVGSQETGPQEISFSNDGRTMYVIGSTGDDITWYTLSTPWNITTASHVSQFSVSTQLTTPLGLTFKPDGTKFYITGTTGTVGAGATSVSEYFCRTPWDLTTAGYTTSYSVISQATNPSDIEFNTDGTQFYVLDNGSDFIQQYSCDTPWSIASGVSVGSSFSVGSQEANPQGFTFSQDGTKLLLTGSSGDDINYYTLSTPWNITTTSFVGIITSVGTGTTLGETAPAGLYWKPDGTKLYFTGTGLDTVWQFNMTSNSQLEVTGKTYLYSDVEIHENLDVYGEQNNYQDAYFYNKVGIGTTNPGARLHVTPTSTGIAGIFSGTTSADMVRITQTGTGNAFVVEDEANPDSTPFVIHSAGPVGVGTTNPSDQLHLQGIFRIDRQLTAQDQTYIRYFRQGSEKARFGLLASDNTIFFNATSTDTANHLVINQSGNVGIGLSNPVGQLQVSSGPVIIGAATSTGTASQTLQVTGGAYVSGNIGVGSANPSEKLDVNGNINLSSFGNYIQKSFADTTEEYILRGPALASYYPFITWTRSTGTTQRGLKIGVHDNIGNRGDWISIWNGSVGIGTTNPTSKLHVIGDILASGNVTGYSDESLKENIQTIPNALDKVIQLRGVEFNRKDIEGNPHQIGVIAQEVEKIIPEVVLTQPNGIKSVAYGNIIGVLIEAIKEQQRQIEFLKTEINTLRQLQ